MNKLKSTALSHDHRKWDVSIFGSLISLNKIMIRSKLDEVFDASIVNNSVIIQLKDKLEL